MIRRYGFPAGAPVFIPGFGAFIQLRGMHLPPIPDSRIGLAGPIYGLGAALAALAASLGGLALLLVWIISHRCSPVDRIALTLFLPTMHLALVAPTAVKV